MHIACVVSFWMWKKCAQLLYVKPERGTSRGASGNEHHRNNPWDPTGSVFHTTVHHGLCKPVAFAAFWKKLIFGLKRMTAGKMNLVWPLKLRGHVLLRWSSWLIRLIFISKAYTAQLSREQAHILSSLMEVWKQGSVRNEVTLAFRNCTLQLYKSECWSRSTGPWKLKRVLWFDLSLC